jgi:hypothetical protein
MKPALAKGAGGRPVKITPILPDEVAGATWEGLPGQTGKPKIGPDLVLERAGLPGLPNANSRLKKRGAK